uniref:Ig-like domain-containing protein n=1 Tax=Sparus aurata TaxID=8175 RepID=A0A671Y8I5_SPAAU
MAELPRLCLLLLFAATPEGLRVRQYPPSLSVMRGETATLSCHFEVESLKYGVQWFKMKSEKQLIAKSARQSVVEKNSTSSLVITEVTPEDSGWYYCEVNVLQKEPEWGNGTELVVLGERQMFLLQKFMPGLYCLVGNYISFVSLLHQSLVSSFCLNSFMTDLEIITPAQRAGPCIDLAQGIETHQKTRQGGMVKLLCGNPSCGKNATFGFFS